MNNFSGRRSSGSEAGKMLRPIFVVIFCVCFSLSAVTKKERIVDQALSDKEPGTADYDHDAFVGSEEAEQFKNLSPEESRRRLGIIVDKIDVDNNGKVTQEELHKWIVFTQTRYIREDSDRQFKGHDKNEDGKIHWDEYKEATYGFLSAEDTAAAENDAFNYAKMIDRDRKRWQKADVDGDDYCGIDEFRAFLHPEEFEHMKEIVVKETLDDIDKNSDGKVDINEYIGDMFKPEDGKEEPDWVASEREQFTKYRDMNKDGVLSEQEIRAWIMPDDYDHAEAEAKHLIYEADDDKDQELTKEEILNHHDKFVGSQATDWGEALNRHDEF